MGCWNETCFITRTPIRFREPVVMVVPIEGFYPSSFLADPMASAHTALIVRGRYDDYGWVEGVSEDGLGDRPDLRSVFVHQIAWDRVASSPKYRSAVARFAGSAKLADDLDILLGGPGRRDEGFWPLFHDWMAVLHFCFLARIDPAGGLPFKGSQDESPDVYQAALELQTERLGDWLAAYSPPGA